MASRSSTVGILNSLLSRSELSLGQLAALVYHLPSFLKLYWRLFSDKRVPMFPAKIALSAMAFYFLSPMDLIPLDLVIPLVGYIDDVFIAIFVLKNFIRWCPREIVVEHVERIERERKGYSKS